MAPRNQFPNRGGGDTAFDGFAITPADADLAELPRALWVGTGGNLNVVMAGGTTVLLKNIANGTLLPIRVNRVLSASTTAADIVGLL